MGVFFQSNNKYLIAFGLYLTFYNIYMYSDNLPTSLDKMQVNLQCKIIIKKALMYLSNLLYDEFLLGVNESKK